MTPEIVTALIPAPPRKAAELNEREPYEVLVVAVVRRCLCRNLRTQRYPYRCDR